MLRIARGFDGEGPFFSILIPGLFAQLAPDVERRDSDSHQQHEQPMESSDNVFASAYDMEDAVCRALDLQTEYAALMRLLEKLQERDRMIFLSRALEERSFAELADEFHIGYKGVAAIYYRTIQRIKKELEERK